jgi:hypothetical protein
VHQFQPLTDGICDGEAAAAAAAATMIDCLHAVFA